MQAVDYVSIILRWIHILAGILWIGLLYFFNFVNGPFTGTMDGDTKKKVIPELAPRALYWFRWGAAYTWFTGILLLGIVYIMGNAALDSGATWNTWNMLLLFSILPMPYVYDFLSKSAIGKNPKVFGAVCFVLVLALVYVAQLPEVGLGYRGYMIYVGGMFGTIMAFNVWFRIWRNQKLIIAGVKSGVPADASIVALAGLRSKHNTYMSVPLVWTMINFHSVALAGPNAWMILGVVILVGWFCVSLLYKKAARVKGF